MAAGDPHSTLPRLRRVEIIPVRQGREQVLALRDPSGLAEETVVVSAATLLILQMLDGRHTMRELQTELMRRTGQLVRSDQIERLIAQFDEQFLLETDRFEEHRRRRLEAFRASGVRLCRDEGGYPREPKAFAVMVDGWRQDLPPRATAATGELVGAIAPHIDYGRGHASYAHVYRDLDEACQADLFIILGTDHYGDTQFAATRCDFETPFGRVRTARDVLERLEQRFIGDLFDGELQHVGEHTIEFQVLLLQHLIGRKRDFEIVPLLCGGLQEEIDDGRSASENAEVRSLTECLGEIMADPSRPACLLASVDLSHVGPSFGGDRPVTPGLLEKIEAHDRAVLDAAVALDPDRLFQVVAGRRNDTNICGLSPLVLAAGSLPPCRGELLDYRQATAPDRSQSVTFAAATFWR